jgi:Uncharacterized protein conserved in bacteria
MKTQYVISVLLFSFLTNLAWSQCISGNCQNGYGEMNCKYGIYKGNFSNGKREGQGTYKYKTGSSYSGRWKNNLKSGYGVFKKRNGDKYEGNWLKGDFHGKGKYSWADGKFYNGYWKAGKRDGYGEYRMTNGYIHKGTFKDDLPVEVSVTYEPAQHFNPRPSNSPTIHVILFADTDDAMAKSVGLATKEYFEDNFVPMLQRTTQMNVQTYIKHGQPAFTLHELEQTIEQLNTSQDDVIFFYFVGHGYNQSNDQFPTMTLGTNGESLYSRSMDLRTVFNKLKAKNHRLLLVVAEACNREYGTAHFGKEQDLTSNFSVSEFSQKRIQKLFSQERGNYLVCSSKKGQDSYFITSRVGYFATAFIDAFSEEARVGNRLPLSWKTIWNKTARKTKEIARRNSEVQEPYYKYFPN